MKINYFLCLILCIGCTSNQDKGIIDETEEIKSISVLLTGRGREIVVTDSNENIQIPEELMCDMYFMKLNKEGKLFVQQGYGEMFSADSGTKTDLVLNSIEQIDSVSLEKVEKERIFRLAEKVYKAKEYVSESTPTDDWLVKLKINDKTYIYYLSESLDTLTLDYLYLIDKIVSISPIKVKYYRN